MAVSEMTFHIGLLNGILPWEKSYIGINGLYAKKNVIERTS